MPALRDVTVHKEVARELKRAQPDTTVFGVPLVDAICNTLHAENEQPALEHVVPAVHSTTTLNDAEAVLTRAMLLFTSAGIVALVAVVKEEDVTKALDAPGHVQMYLT